MAKGKSKIWLIIAIGLVGLLVIGGIATKVKMDSFKKEFATLKVNEVDLNKVKDGVYKGECDLTIVSAVVEVSVENSTIKSIKLIKHNHGPEHGADAIVNTIVKEQKILVDVISGATGSSTVVQKAVENALKKGVE